MAVVADEPTGFGIGESDAPVTADVGQLIPRLAFVGSPCALTGGEIRRRFAGDDYGSIIFVIAILYVGEMHAAGVGQTEDCSLNRRCVGESPSLASVIGDGHLRVVAGGQIAAADNAIQGIAERDAESAGGWVTGQRSIGRVP